MGMQMKTGRSQGRMISEINVTPLVDVMLVLLIIFMVAAPMMIQGIDVNLPAASARPIPTETERLVVSITSDGRVYINDSAVDFEMLGPELISLYMKSQDKRGVILRADRKVEYGLVAQAMGAIREAGIDQIGMVTEPLSERQKQCRTARIESHGHWRLERRPPQGGKRAWSPGFHVCGQVRAVRSSKYVRILKVQVVRDNSNGSSGL